MSMVRSSFMMFGFKGENSDVFRVFRSFFRKGVVREELSLEGYGVPERL